MQFGSDGDCTVPGTSLNEPAPYYTAPDASAFERTSKATTGNGIPTLFEPEEIVHLVGSISREVRKGEWVPARPMGYRSLGFWHNFKLAWGVFTGKYDAIKWDQQ